MSQRSEPLRLHLGGEEAKEGWKILNAQPGPGVDFVGPCDDLSQFADASVDQVYASHIFEHLGLFEELPRTLYEVSRVLKIGGMFRIAVPDLEMVARLLVSNPDDLKLRFHLIRLFYGGQQDAYDYHKAGFTLNILATMLRSYCFDSIERVASFGLFKDCSEVLVGQVPISLNVSAVRAPGKPPAEAFWMPQGYIPLAQRTPK